MTAKAPTRAFPIFTVFAIAALGAAISYSAARFGWPYQLAWHAYGMACIVAALGIRRRWLQVAWLLRAVMLIAIMLALWGMLHLSQLSTDGEAAAATPVREGEIGAAMAARTVFGAVVVVAMALCALAAVIASWIMYSSWRGALARWLLQRTGR